MKPFSVSQFVEFVNTALTTAVFPEGAVIEGEIVEYRVSQDKWIWFQLKDQSAIISCFATKWQLRTPLEDGMQVRVFGLPKVHPKSGKFSVTVERVELMGEGALRRAFELLKKRLSEEGLFAPERKRPIPRFPERVGLIASRESAAYSDFLRILKNRWGGIDIRLAHVQVQGRDAVREIVGAFHYFNRNPDLAEVLVLTRGGGSLEDLQAFNSEEVARAVFASKIPVVVAVGHERDETLADYAADVRASTPTNAAEMVVPDRKDMVAVIDGGVQHMSSAMRGAIGGKQAAVKGLADQVEAHARRGIEDFKHMIKDLARHRLTFAAAVAARGEEAAALERMLRNLDPRRLLERGYALIRSGGKVVRDAAAVDIGDALDIQLWKGGLVTEVKKKI